VLHDDLTNISRVKNPISNNIIFSSYMEINQPIIFLNEEHPLQSITVILYGN